MTEAYQQIFSEVVTNLGINFAPFFQIDFIKHDSKLHVIDAGIELDPAVAFILSETFQYNVYHTMVMMAMNNSVDFPQLSHPGFTLKYIFSDKDYFTAPIKENWENKLQGSQIHWNFQPDNKVGTTTTNRQRLGYYLKT